MVFCEKIDEPVLGMVRILILIHQHITELSLILFQNLRELLKDLHGFHDDVVKVQGIVLLELFLVKNIGICYFIHAEMVLIFLFKIQWIQQGILCRGHMGNGFFLGEILLIHRKLLQHLLHQGLLVIAVINGKVLFVA